MKANLLTAILAIGLQTIVFPKAELLMLAGIAIVLDFVTGVAKSKFLGIARTSEGFRKTIIKILQYAGAVSVSILLSLLVKYDKEAKFSELCNYFTNGLIAFIVYIELTSIIENLYQIDAKSVFAKRILKPLLSILTFQWKNNPAVKLLEEQANKQKEDEKDNK